MTTRILVVNHGPNGVHVTSVARAMPAGAERITAVGDLTPVYPRSQQEFHVHDYQYLMIEEVPRGQMVAPTFLPAGVAPEQAAVHAAETAEKPS